MSHDHHNDNHGSEPKPVSFTVPLIFGIVVVFIILSFVSLGNPCPEHDCAENCSKECKEKCEKGEHGAEMKHGEGHASEATEVHEEHGTAAVAADSAKTEAAAEPAKEEKKEEAHH